MRAWRLLHCAGVGAGVAACSASSTSTPLSDAGQVLSDATTTADASSHPSDATAPLPDGSTDSASDSPSGTSCGEFAGDTLFRCSKDGNSRGKCVDDASAEIEACPNGCLRMPTTQDDVCMGSTDTFSCTGAYGTTKSQDGNYYLTEFGCWVDSAGTTHTDSSDNCIPSCLTQARQAGLCAATDTGPQCEEKIDWFTADGARFGCLARLRVTNPKTGMSVIAVALDFGPGCSGENTVQMEVLDASGRVDEYLFGGPEGASDRALVHVVEVDRSTPLGPVP